MNRRELLRLTGAAGGTLLLTACIPDTSKPATPTPVETTGTAGKYQLGRIEGPEIITDPAQLPKAFKEAPELADLVRAGSLPPVAQRLGQDPIVVKPLHEIGAYGGTLRRAFIGLDRNLNRFGTGPDTLVYYDYKWQKLIPNIARSFELSADNRVLTVQLRRGMKWSDGAPFTADDFVFWYEDIYLNKALSTASKSLLINGKDVRIEKTDATTVRYVSPDPNPILPHLLAGFGDLGGQAFTGWTGRGGFAPKHYLSQFHPKYVSGGQAAADKMASDAKATSWSAFFLSRNEWLLNAELPVIAPWKVVKGREHNTDSWTMERNPYSVWVDTAGNQLPYISKLQATPASNSEIISLRAIAGELDFQERYIELAKLPLYLDNAAKGNYKIHLTPSQTPDLGVRLNLAYNDDPEIGSLIRNVSFRRALALGIDRVQINEAFFLGTDAPWSASPAETNPYFPGPDYVTRWATLDLAQANKLLDDLGLKMGSDGFRQRRDGAGRLRLNAAALAGSTADFPSMTEMVKQHWLKLGIETVVESAAGALLNQRALANQLQLSVVTIGSEDPFLFPDLVVPLNNGNYPGMIGIPYANWYLTGGKSGKEPFDEVKQIQALWEKGFSAPDAERRQIGKEIFKLHVDQVFSIGIVGPGLSSTGMFLAKNSVGNVPERTLHATQLRSPTNALPQTFYIKG